jgi:hypothetical protein
MMTTETQASETTVDDHLRNLIQLMKRGARLKLFDLPDDPSFLSSNIGGGMSQAIADRLEAALSAAEPVGWQWRNPRWTVGDQWQHCPDGPREDKLPGTEYRPVYAAPTAPSVAVKAILAELDNVLVNDEQDRETLAKIRTMVSALSAQVQDVAEGWQVASNSGSVLIYCLKQDGWRKGEPVMVNDIMIRVENANRSSNELQPIVDAIMRALPAAPAKQEG